MSDLPESLNRARAQAFSRPAWEGVQGQRPPRPMPRQMRPPAQRANDPRLAQSERDRALRQFDGANAANADTYQRQAFDQRDQVAEAASMAAESTGLPAIRRAGSDLTRWGAYTAGTEQGNDDLASGALNLGAGSLGVLGMAGMVPRAPMRGALRPPVTAPEMMAPSRITRPPMAPPRTARPPAQAPDAGGGRGGQQPYTAEQVLGRSPTPEENALHTGGFDLRNEYFHGAGSGELIQLHVRGNPHRGDFVTPEEFFAEVSRQSRRIIGGERTPREGYERAVAALAQRGKVGVWGGNEATIWNGRDVAMRPGAGTTLEGGALRPSEHGRLGPGIYITPHERMATASMPRTAAPDVGNAGPQK